MPVRRPGFLGTVVNDAGDHATALENTHVEHATALDQALSRAVEAIAEGLFQMTKGSGCGVSHKPSTWITERGALAVRAVQAEPQLQPAAVLSSPFRAYNSIRTGGNGHHQGRET
ncbi:MAG: hypothetical protein JWN85_233 [Gammaproteobacteria bacterium]|nr:hypothetical protein [Gammaproteobacteria bacterium]